MPASRRRRSPEPQEGAPPRWYAPPVDPTLLRLQAQLEAIEAERARAAHGEREEGGDGHCEPTDDVIIDLDEPAPVASAPTELAAEARTDEWDPRWLIERVEELERRLVVAENRARSAEARARAVAARAEDILFALPDLAHELRLLVDAGEPTVAQLEAAIERMRARVTPQRLAEEPAELDPELEPVAADAD